MAKNLTRKEITEDSIRHFLLEAYEWISTHLGLLLGSLGGIVLLAILWATLQWYQAGQLARATADFSGALATFNQPIVTQEDAESNPDIQPSSFATEEERDTESLVHFQKIRHENPGSKLGDLSGYFTGLAQRRLGEKEKALQIFQEVAETAAEPILQALAGDQFAQIALELGKNKEAQEAWNQVLENSSTHLPRLEIMTNLALSYDAVGAKDDALKWFKRIKSEFPLSPDAASIEARIVLLEAEVTETTKTLQE